MSGFSPVFACQFAAMLVVEPSVALMRVSSAAAPTGSDTRCGVSSTVWSASGIASSNVVIPTGGTAKLADRPSGEVLISQYREPPAGETGRALELFNASTETIDLAESPLLIYRYQNASQERLLETEVKLGLWKPGEVVVVGDQATRNFLLDSGFLPANAVMESGGTLGTPFTRSGELLFVLDNLGYSGDDALEIQLGWTRSDVFGMPGEDPGEAWLGNNVRTMDAEIELHPLASFGTRGFRDPDLRFRLSETGEPFEGFGQAPLFFDNAYVAWLDEARVPAGKRDFFDDSDGDRLPQVLEFALGTCPLVRSPNPLQPTKEGGFVLLSESARGLGIDLVVEVSEDLTQWETFDITRLELGNDVIRWTWPSPLLKTEFIRLGATLLP